MVTHNIQIGVNVDEESIRNAVIEGAAKDIQLGMFGRAITHGWSAPSFTREFEREVLEPLLTDIFSSDEFKERVAEKTAVIMADKLAKSKKFKDAVDSNLK